MRAVVGPGYGVSCVACAEEDAVVHPLGLDELELPPKVSADEREHQAAVLPVVFEGPFGQWRTVGSSGSTPEPPAETRQKLPVPKRAKQHSLQPDRNTTDTEGDKSGRPTTRIAGQERGNNQEL
jgi:hypothetical protein